jgi:heme-degrading monooxygenase HmoA
MEPVTWINVFEVPAGREDEFFALWRKDFMPHFRAKPGFMSYRMYRSVAPEARFRFVNVTLWESAEHIKAAHDDRFRELVARPEMAGIAAAPGIYEVVSEG